MHGGRKECEYFVRHDYESNCGESVRHDDLLSCVVLLLGIFVVGVLLACVVSIFTAPKPAPKPMLEFVLEWVVSIFGGPKPVDASKPWWSRVGHHPD